MLRIERRRKPLNFLPSEENPIDIYWHSCVNYFLVRIWCVDVHVDILVWIITMWAEPIYLITLWITCHLYILLVQGEQGHILYVVFPFKANRASGVLDLPGAIAKDTWTQSSVKSVKDSWFCIGNCSFCIRMCWFPKRGCWFRLNLVCSYFSILVF